MQWRSKFAMKDAELEAVKVGSNCFHSFACACVLAAPTWSRKALYHPTLCDRSRRGREQKDMSPNAPLKFDYEADLQARNTDLAKQISSLQALSSSEGHQSSSQVRSLTERAANAEKRCTHLSSQIAQLEAKLAEIQARSGQAENKWEARVKEYENRLRIAGEKIKTEKQGGKERAVQLEAQVR